LKPDQSQIKLSSIDEERFGIRTARALVSSLEELRSANDFCRANDVTLLIARCPTSQTQTAQEMEREGFLLMDTLVYYTRDLEKTPLPSDQPNASIRLIRPGEEEAVKAIATETFGDYLSHYHSDDRLDRAKCNEVYPSWAYRSCVSREVADDILIAEMDGSVVGFVTLQLSSPQEGAVVLGGVSHSAQGYGIYRSFLIRGMDWLLSKGATRMIVSTQITNIAVQKVWARIGFELAHAKYTFHKWFDSQ
jgi:RimJ/RimL family protein N-acetyltransferase